MAGILSLSDKDFIRLHDERIGFFFGEMIRRLWDWLKVVNLDVTCGIPIPGGENIRLKNFPTHHELKPVLLSRLHGNAGHVIHVSGSGLGVESLNNLTIARDQPTRSLHSLAVFEKANPKVVPGS